MMNAKKTISRTLCTIRAIDRFYNGRPKFRCNLYSHDLVNLVNSTYLS